MRTRGTPSGEQITPMDIYRCYERDLEFECLQDSNASQNKASINAFSIMSKPETHP